MVPTLGAATLQVPVNGWDSTVTPKAAPSATLMGKVNPTCAPLPPAAGVGDTTSLPLTSSRPFLVSGPVMLPLSSMLPPPLPPQEASATAQSRARPERTNKLFIKNFSKTNRIGTPSRCPGRGRRPWAGPVWYTELALILVHLATSGRKRL